MSAAGAPSPHAAGLKTEAALLDSLVRVSRLQHRRAPYFARVLDMRRRLHAVLPGLKGGSKIRSNAVANTELALHAIPAAWKEMHLLLTQSFFMPYALTHLALLARVAALLAAHHTHLRSTLPRGAPAAAPAALPPPRLLALSTSTSADAALGRIFGGADAAPVAASASGSAAPSVSTQQQQQQQQQEDLGDAAGGEDLGEAMTVDELPVEADAAVSLPEAAAAAPEASRPCAAAAVAAAPAAVDLPAEETAVLWEIDPTPSAASPHQSGTSVASGAVDEVDEVDEEPDVQAAATASAPAAGPNGTSPAANGWVKAALDAPAGASVHKPEEPETSRAPRDFSNGSSLPSLLVDAEAPVPGAGLEAASRRRKRRPGSLDRLVSKYRLL